MFHMTIDWPTERPHLAVVRSVIDGDTFRADIDLDLKLQYDNYKVRLAGSNAWESKTEAGKAATENLEALLYEGRQIVLLTIKDYKYGGEFIARVFLEDGTELVPLLIREQWAAPWNGRGSAPKPPWPRMV